MATLLDDRLGLKRETTWGVPVTVDRFYPWLDDNEGEWDPRPRQGQGLQGGAGRRAMLGSRRVLPRGQAKVTTKVELESKAAGVLLDLALGVSTVTAITGGSQQLFHTGIAGTVAPSATIQLVKVLNGGSEYVETYAGCTAGKIKIEQPEDDIATLEVEWDGYAISEATPAASQTYATNPVLFDAYQGSVGLGGTLVAPTTTALASGLTVFNGAYRSWVLELEQGIDTGRWVIGNRNQPTVGMPKYKYTAKVEFNASTIPAALIAGTKLAWYQTWTTSEVLGAGNTQLQVVVPQLALTAGMSKVKSGETRIVDVKADITNDGVNRDLWVVYRTTDVAL